MTPVLLSPRAARDEAQILEYLATEAGLGVALNYRDKFRSLYRLLAEHPDIGTRRAALGRNVRRAVVTPYLVFFRHERQTVTVLRVLHGRRNITAGLVSP